jgi:hypothetical protein
MSGLCEDERCSEVDLLVCVAWLGVALPMAPMNHMKMINNIKIGNNIHCFHSIYTISDRWRGRWR